jgi:adenylate kinase
MDKGQLVPDEITINMLKNRLLQEDCKKGFILDGVPRTIKQAEMLKDVTDVDMFLNLIVRDHILVERMTTRRTCKSCGAIFNVKNSPPKIEGKCDHCSSELIQRDDEKPAVIQDRLKVYETNTKPLINFYKELELLEELDAEADAYDQKIQKEMFRILGVED